MLTKEDLQLLETLFDKKLEPINERLEKIEERLDTIEENSEITREATNYLVEWVEKIDTDVDALKFQMPK